VIRINLAPEAKRRRAVGFGFSLPTLTLPSLDLGTVFGVVYVLAVVGIAGYWWMLGSERAKLTAEIATGQAELAQLRVTIGQVNQIKAQAQELRARLALLEELMKGQGRPIALVDIFASVIPKDLWITGFETREDFRLKVSGSAFSTTAVSDFMQNLRSSGKFQDVDIVISRRDLSKPAGLVTFEVTCRFQG
jgi:Tfp pilus assembly protein PilN